MNLQQSPTCTGTRNESKGHIQGAWLLIARIVWVILALLAIGLLFASLPSYFAYLHRTNATSIYDPQLAPSDVRELHRLGLSLDFYAWLNISVFLIVLLVWVSIGIVLFWRKSDDRMALLASLSLVLFPIVINTPIVGTLPCGQCQLNASNSSATCASPFSSTCFLVASSSLPGRVGS